MKQQQSTSLIGNDLLGFSFSYYAAEASWLAKSKSAVSVREAAAAEQLPTGNDLLL